VTTYGAGTSISPSQRRILPAVTVSNIHQTNVDISFDVDRIGVPVELGTSFFPNWHASGAKGPYRSVPNHMVVVPTKHHVHIRYGYSNPDRIGWAATILGVLWLALPTIRRVGKRRTSAA
jgi:hypothetical protein